MQGQTTESVRVLFCDSDLLAVEKAPGVPSQGDPTGAPDVLSLLSPKYGTLYPVHRLDRPVGGVMAIARNPATAAAMSRLVQDHSLFKKEYLAVLPCEVTQGGELTDLLYHDKISKRAFSVKSKRAGVKEARLEYQPIATRQEAGDTFTLVRIRLHTGRFHQIRVQFATRGMPLLGDGKYGSRIKCPLALLAYRLTFPHPKSGETVSFQVSPPKTFPWKLFEGEVK